jgi:nicotinic acid phosphoribosyltransferase
LALAAVRAAGIRRTSHVEGARALDMLPVGTMGHEHVQRFGSDREAFRAMRDRRPQRSSYLLDTFDAVASGIPAALELLEQAPSRRDSVRFDSGDQVTQLRLVHRLASERGLRPVYILEDGYDAARTREMEALRAELGIAPADLFYGYGGSLVANHESGMTRDRVAAVYKLSDTDGLPVMKFAKAGGGDKRSAPGRPVVMRRVSGDGPLGLIGQEGEAPPPGYVTLTGSTTIVDVRHEASASVAASLDTRALEAACEERSAR